MDETGHSTNQYDSRQMTGRFVQYQVLDIQISVIRQTSGTTHMLRTKWSLLRNEWVGSDWNKRRESRIGQCAFKPDDLPLWGR